MKTLFKSPTVLFFLLMPMLIGIAPVTALPEPSLNARFNLDAAVIDLGYAYDFSVYLDSDACFVAGVPVILSFSQNFDVAYQRRNGDVVMLRMGSNLLTGQIFPATLIKLASGVCSTETE